MKLDREKFTCFLDTDDRHPALLGECILPRDDDGMGYALNLQRFRGKHVRITVEELPMPKGTNLQGIANWCGSQSRIRINKIEGDTFAIDIKTKIS